MWCPDGQNDIWSDRYTATAVAIIIHPITDIYYNILHTCTYII